MEREKLEKEAKRQEEASEEEPGTSAGEKRPRFVFVSLSEAV